MTSETIESESMGKPAPEPERPKGKREPNKTARPAKRAGRAKKAAKPKTERANKKAEVVALMKRAKGATLAEIVKTTGWQPHTIRGFVSILRQQGRRENRIVEERRRRAELPHHEVARPSANAFSKRRFRLGPGRRFRLCRPHCSASDVTDPSRHLAQAF